MVESLTDVYVYVYIYFQVMCIMSYSLSTIRTSFSVPTVVFVLISSHFELLSDRIVDVCCYRNAFVGKLGEGSTLNWFNSFSYTVHL